MRDRDEAARRLVYDDSDLETPEAMAEFDAIADEMKAGEVYPLTL